MYSWNVLFDFDLLCGLVVGLFAYASVLFECWLKLCVDGGFVVLYFVYSWFEFCVWFDALDVCFDFTYLLGLFGFSVEFFTFVVFAVFVLIVHFV